MATDVDNVHGSPTPAPSAQPIDWWDIAGDEVEGYDLVKDQALFSLVGVPFMATKAVFRDGIQAKGVDYRNDYVSLEIHVAPARMFKIPRILSRRTGDLIADKSDFAQPEEFLVINDGSTGIYRQVMEYLVAKGQITLPDGPMTGEKNECVLDLPRSQWLTGANANEDEPTEFDIVLKCPRGLRYSDYDSEYAAPGERALTWYIA